MGSIAKVEEEGLETGEEWSSEAVVYVNGVRRVLPDGMAHVTLLQYLRGPLHLLSCISVLEEIFHGFILNFLTFPILAILCDEEKLT